MRKKEIEINFYYSGKTNTSIHGSSNENHMNMIKETTIKIPITIFIARLYSILSVFSSISDTDTPVSNTTTNAHVNSLANGR